MELKHALTRFLETEGDEFVLEKIEEHDGGMWDYCVTSVLLKHIPTGLKFRLTAEFDDRCYDVGIGVDYAEKVTHATI